MAEGATIRELFVKIGLEVQNLSAMQKVDNGLANLIKRGTKVAVALAVMREAFKYTIGSASETAKFAVNIKWIADNLGLTTGMVQRLRGVANLSGIEFEKMTLAITNLTRLSGSALSGNINSMNLFRNVGVKSLKNSNGELKTQVELMEEIADNMQGLSAQQQNYYAAQLFGARAANSILFLMQSGSKGIKEAFEEVKKKDYILTKRDIEIAIKYREQLKDLKVRSQAMQREIGMLLIPPLSKALSILIQIGDVNSKIWKAHPEFLQFLHAVSSTTSFLFKGISDSLGLIFGLFTNLIDLMHELKQLADWFNKKHGMGNEDNVGQIKKGYNFYSRLIQGDVSGEEFKKTFIHATDVKDILRRNPFIRELDKSAKHPLIGQTSNAPKVFNHNPTVNITVNGNADNKSIDKIKTSVNDTLQEHYKQIYAANPVGSPA